MVDTYKIWNDLIKGLNSINPNYTFIKANMNGNMPKYPYGTVNILNANIQDRDTLKGTITRENVPDSTKVKINRTTTPKMVFSINAYSNKLQDCLQMMKETQDWLTFSGKQYLESCDIVILECSTLVDRTSFLEVEYQYQFGFDLTVRVPDIISKEVDSIANVEVTNELDNSKIEIGGN